ncbi:MAG: acetylglutamate kinase [Spirochaetaceae bacterium]
MRVLVKLGGRAIEQADQRRLTAGEIRTLRERREVILVHGGGYLVTELSERLGIGSRFVDGIRMTGEAEMDVVDMVLAGAVNTQLVRVLNHAGVSAVGLTGADAQLVTGVALAASAGEHEGAPGTGVTTHTGTPASVAPGIVETLLAAGHTPVCGSVAADAAGRALNINADDFAVALAGALAVDACLFISDTDGVLLNGEVRSGLTASQVEAAVADGTIYGGMIPKVRAALAALDGGAAAAVIGTVRDPGDLLRILRGTRGTRIEP